MNEHLYKLFEKGIYSYRNIFKNSKKLTSLKRKYFENLDFELTNGTKEWNNFQQRLHDSLLHNDLKNFLQWQVINDTMFFNSPRIEFNALKNSKDWKLLKKGIKESHIGNPKPFKYYIRTSGNLVHHAYSLLQMVNIISIDKIIELNEIVEFGGGYGSFCRLIYNLGYKGEYKIIDFEIFSRLQKFYLELTLEEAMLSHIEFKTKLEKIDFSDSLFVGLWSISEAPIEVRKRILPSILNSKYILIAYQNRFSSIDNQKYFNEYLMNNRNYDWSNYSIKHLPNNHYLIGIRIC